MDYFNYGSMDFSKFKRRFIMNTDETTLANLMIAIQGLTNEVHDLVNELEDLNFNMNTGVKYIVESDLEKELHDE